MTTLFQDLRFGARLLRRQPGFTLVAILVLTVGIGVNTAAFSFVNALLLKPRTGKIDHELVGVYSRHRLRPDDYRAFSWADYTWLRDRRDLFRSLTAHGFGLAGLKEGDVTRRVFADIVSANLAERSRSKRNVPAPTFPCSSSATAPGRVWALRPTSWAARSK